MDEDPSRRRTFLERLRRTWRAARLWFVFASGLIGAVAALSLQDTGSQPTVGLQAGDVSPQDVVAPYDLSFTSVVLTEEARQAAAAAVPDIYDPPDSQVTRVQVDRLRATFDFIDTIRADSHAGEADRLADLAAAADVRLDEATARAILNLPDARWEAVKLESIAVLEQVLRSEIREGQLQEVRRSVPALVSISLPSSQADLVVQLVSAFVVPNSFYNDAATQAARAEAHRAVAPVVKAYRGGETIIRGGEVVTPLHIEGLEAFGLLREPDPWGDLAIRSLLVMVLGSTFALYAYRVNPKPIENIALSATLSVAFVLTAAAMRLMIPGHTVLPYLFPVATVPILATILIGPGMGLMAALAMGAMAGYLAPRGLELAMYFIFGGALGALVIGEAERLSAFFWAGLASSLAAIAIIVVFRFPDPATDIWGKGQLIAVAVASGLLSASMAFGLLLLIGNLLGITTTLQLIELSRPDHPLLQFILRNAPGTYQHSLQVANLAEQAARAIGANALLTRVGALYHDAGKALRPQFFIENQLPGQNVHEQLDPATSASVILSHVRDGLELARKYRLPPRIRAFIPEHHGTLEATYQYQAAVTAARGEAGRIDRRDFTYPGPRPRSRETAILMLADGVEAKARAEMPRSEEDIEGLVRWVIEDRLAKRQLERTDLTLKDLDVIRRSFVNTLRGIFHPRLRYPEGPQDLDQEEPVRATASAPDRA